MKYVVLPYQPDALALFEKLRSLPMAALLHSGACGGAAGRYDVMAADPLRQITFDGGVLHIGRQTIRTSRPFDALRGAMPLRERVSPHFKAGFIGYFGYALQHSLERLPPCPIDPTGFPALYGGDYGWSIVTDHEARTTQLWYRETTPTSTLRRVEHALESCPAVGSFAVAPNFSATTDERAYRSAFDRVKHYIDAGDCYQVNLARHFRARLHGDHLTASWFAYRRLAAAQPGPFGAYLATPYGAVVCVSPERFIRFTHDRIETAPIKGTAPRHVDAVDDVASRDGLRRCEKNRAENIMIVDLLRNDIGRICVPGTVAAPELFAIETFANVHHLVSRVRGIPRPGVDAWGSLTATFPGGSVTGAPKVRAMAIINELEPVARSVYCGSIGYVDDGGTMDTNIAIRTLVFTQTDVHAWGGGAIVADSVATQELAEIEHKIGRMLHATAALADNSSCSS